MSGDINNIERNRERIAIAYLDFCQRNYGGKWVDVTVGRKKVRVDVTQQSIEAVMKEFIENLLRAEFGIAAGQQQIVYAYNEMLSADHGLTQSAVSFLEEAMQEAVADKLAHPKSTLLQVVC